MGFIFIFSIVVDTFVVRTVLVPAMLSLSPCLNYWPSKMPEPKISTVQSDTDIACIHNVSYLRKRQDSVSKIQKRFPAKVLPYAMQGPNGEAMSFYGVWDRIVEFLRYEGKVTSREIGDLSYCADADSNVQWKQLNSPLDSGMREFRRPQIFRGTNVAENFLRRYMIQGQEGWPTNREAKWRLQALARGLGLPLPVPYRVPYIPGISVLIPHYGESILAEKQLELLRERRT
eukprot:s2603_g7.t1